MPTDATNSSLPAQREKAPLAGVTRLAPSPTGALHLGNAFAFVLNWAIARQRGWRVLLRIEDLDTPRVKPGSIDQTIELIAWLGLDWDQPPEIQSHDLAPYASAMRELAQRGLVYPCELTRAEIQAAASAPQEGSGETVFAESLRPNPIEPTAFTGTGRNWRFVVPEAPIQFTDHLAGPQTIALPKSIGDFVVWTKRGQPSYQLAVVVDDHASGVTQIVRGNDLLDSAARQLALYQALHLTPLPHYWHLPLVRGEDGLRLAKRHGDTRLATWKTQGLPRQRVLGLIAHWAGLLPAPEPIEAAELRERLDPSTIPAHDLVFDERALTWLTSG